MSAKIKEVLLVVAVLSLFLAIAPVSHAALSAAGPVDPDNGFPAWYQDATGLSLAPCFDNNGFCASTMVAGPGDPFNPTLPIVFPTNFPQMFFYFKADAFANTTHYTAALAGAFASGTVLDGNQIVFSRIRFIDPTAPAGTYTIAHPYGVDTVEVTAADAAAGTGLRFTEDLGLGGTPFTNVLGGRIGPFLRNAGGLVTSPDGKVYIGNSVTAVPVTGTAVTSVTVEGPISAATNTFILEGKVIGISVSPKSIVFPAQRPGVDSTPRTVTVNNLSNTPLELNAIAPSGPNAVDFTVAANTCPATPNSLAANASCTFNVVFNGAAGTSSRTANIMVSNTGGAVSPVTIALSGTIDSVAPTVVAHFPNTATAPLNITLMAVFREPMNQATIDSTTFRLAGPNGPVAGTVTYDTVNNTATFIPSQNLTGAATYTATITTGATDLAGNPLAASFIWSFTATAPDTTPPTIISVSPPNNAIGVPVSSPIKATFSEQMNAASINATTFAVSGGVTGTVTYDAGTNTATFTPSASLAPGTPYTAVIKGGPGGVSDMALNTLVNDFQWTFLTNYPPSVPGLVSPADGATGLPATVTLTWTKSTDDDGDTLSYQVFVCNNQFFIGCSPNVVAASAHRLSGIYFAGVGGLGMALIGLMSFGGIKGGKRMLLALAIVMMAGVLIYSCGGSGGSDGGGSGGDTTPPTVPSGVTATAVSQSQIDLAWTASSDNVGVAGYTIFRGGIFLTSVATGTSISVTGLSPSTNYCHTINAHDAAGNESAQSDTACATTQPGAVASSNELSFTATGLNPGTLYFWRVEALDPNGGAAFSETRSFRTL